MEFTATSTPSDPRIKRTRAALCSALLSLLEEQSFDQITIRDIAVRRESAMPTFFGNYDSKGSGIA